MRLIRYVALLLLITTNTFAADTICPTITSIQSNYILGRPREVDANTYLALIGKKIKTKDASGNLYVWNIYAEHKAYNIYDAENGIELNVSNLVELIAPLEVRSLYHLPATLVCRYDLKGFYTFNNKLEHDDIFAVEISTLHSSP